MAEAKQGYDIVLGGDFTPTSYGMFSAQADAVKHRYDIHVGKSGRIWLVSTSDDRAQNVYAQGGPGSRGFGGSELTFTLRNGVDRITLKGPWASNTGALFEDTGFDIRKEHYTFGVIGTGRKSANNTLGSMITGVIYFDPKPVKGDFNRIDDLAQAMANERGETLYYYRESHGGSSLGPVDPRKS